MIENFRIRVFRAVAQHLNFSRAAEELLLTQPAVTQQIKALEDEFGVPLFDRGGGHIALTAGGKVLLPFAERMREPPRPSVNTSYQRSWLDFGGQILRSGLRLAAGIRMRCSKLSLRERFTWRSSKVRNGGKTSI
jgi:DNA-binding transcriptional ArsR family regulator